MRRYTVSGRMTTRIHHLNIVQVLFLILGTTGCLSAQPSPVPSPATPWIEEEVTFTSGPNE